MSRDDYWDRVDDYQRYADYKYDQKIFEQDLGRRSSELYTALRKKDYNAAEWALGISKPSGGQAETQPENNQQSRQTVQSELPLLISEIRQSDYITDHIKAHWIKGLSPITWQDRNTAQRRIADFKAAFAGWKMNNRPQQDIWDIGNTQRWLFDTEMLLIECKIDRLVWLLSRPEHQD